MNKEFMIPEPTARHEYDSFSAGYEARKEAAANSDKPRELPIDAKLTLARYHLRKALALGLNQQTMTEVVKALTHIEELLDAPHTK